VAASPGSSSSNKQGHNSSSGRLRQLAALFKQLHCENTTGLTKSVTQRSKQLEARHLLASAETA
jgi:hypothetical protein